MKKNGEASSSDRKSDTDSGVSSARRSDERAIPHRHNSPPWITEGRYLHLPKRPQAES